MTYVSKLNFGIFIDIGKISMNFNNFRSVLMSFSLATSVLFFIQGEAFAGQDHCQSAKCLKHTKKLIDLGYDELIAERIAVYRPDLSYLITHPDVPIRPAGFQDSLSNRNQYDKWFSNEFFVQDRRPITVYRGLTFRDGEKFDPTYYLKGDFPITDARIFTSDDPGVALSCANSEGKQGILLKMQIPRFMVSEVKPGPYGLVYFRDLVPNDLFFVNGAASVSYTPYRELRRLPSDTEEWVFDEVSKKERIEDMKNHLASIRFEPLPEDDHRIVRTPLTHDELIGKDGRFVPTQSWVNLVCRIRNHPIFAFLSSKITDEKRKEEFVAIFNPFEGELEKNTLIQEKRKIDQARITLRSIPIPQRQNARTEEETIEIMVQYTAGEAEHCLNSKQMWLDAQIDKERKKIESQFLSTHKALHGMCEDTTESNLIKSVLMEKQEMQEIEEKIKTSNRKEL